MLITDSATDDTKILDSSTVVDTYNTSSSVLITTQSSSKRKKRSAADYPIHTYGPNPGPGCKYGMHDSHFILKCLYTSKNNLYKFYFLNIMIRIHFFLAVFADGSRDARDTKELAINQKFFPINYKGFDGRLEKFKIRLNVSIY